MNALLPSQFPIHVVEYVGKEAFVEHWSRLYSYKLEHLYDDNIGRPLTEERVLALFTWKNGTPIAAPKQASVRRNYIVRRPIPPRLGNRGELLRFISLPGGAVWRIFWLHCYSPADYPIFDQHVFRAMRHLKYGHIEEVPSATADKARIYADEYLPFYAAFESSSPRLLDRALWAYGKHLKGPHAA